MMRKKIAAGNWKMHTTVTQGEALLQEVATAVTNNQTAEMMIFAPFTHLDRLQRWVIENQSTVRVGAQNCAYKNQGAFTGEVSIDMLSDLGIRTVLIGHSERRSIFGETAEVLRQKVDLALSKEFTVVFCVGEHLSEREGNTHLSVVKQQLTESLFQVSANQMTQVVIAYEPVWAIGTGKTASPEQAQEMHAFIRTQLEDRYGKEIAQATRILYGGSVKADNAAELFSQPDIDGGLVGGASLVASDFKAIFNAAR